ncbi:peptide chain release factor N(5)-glutamine methyltransferase [Rathayibacter toxicus]|uniref:peptide chain release factor N(5)-glutamine methyltransferase n=1 Tax=Rathayibacter toxicus TaxID=145458 RepID=UPI000CE817CF|nr:peptide chain release factor N(5)-glutamine methyltransferase [Rathayibacter toxicus]PPI54242.1 peptide chain release factor N(5)-glutamine methyltransferase [Rathayibacter toxicus]QOD11055.1 peptide chain release factor N(5)-glutamine methyltransferase [Rathayibacter toxicus]QWL27799.1 peptide chain release factor N(5)-glutamine methyltransferase [Rathayibacter toxicus]
MSARDGRALLAEAIRRLIAAEVPTPDVDAELLLAQVAGFSRGELHARLITGLILDESVHDAFNLAISRRAAREPLQHIMGIAPFRSLELAVGPGVFVPRPETEVVVQIAIDALRAVAEPAPIAVDLGTGSGAIALALAHEVPHASVIGVENAVEAFGWALGNCERLGLDNVRLVCADLAQALPELDDSVSVVVSNPPYIPAAAVPRDPEVRFYDPPSALYGGDDGLEVVRDVSVTARRLLRSGGVLVIEHGELQGRELRELLRRDGWCAVTTQRDLAGRDRATVAVR